MLDESRADVVIVGGGIAGGSLACALADVGLDVLVVEQQDHYRDRVRGESVSCWGVQELQALGVEDELLGAGGTYADTFIGYDEALTPAEAVGKAVSLDRVVSGVPGMLDVGHPQACAALRAAGFERGARVVAGVHDVVVEAGSMPSVAYRVADREYRTRCRLVVGADGGRSVVRRQVGIALRIGRAEVFGGGVLINNLADWPSNVASFGGEDGDVYFVLPRKPGQARLYLLCPRDRLGRFVGRDKNRKLVEALRLRCIPGSAMFAAATPSRSCSFTPMTESSAERVCAPGVVLIGDAAGWSDPVIGQGLSVAFRDARFVRDLLCAEHKWSVETFVPYEVERAERMRRLRICSEVRNAMYFRDDADAIARRKRYWAMIAADPVLAGSRAAILAGPFAVPDECFNHSTVEQLLSIG
ncbi:FAD-dependent oxidoreductase [Nocardia sp. NPDC006044]|uniref:FAD-dependent oxidoreductase n=1 Tax=Nocardia sp. NPDC006044 TaxID=3364306 RepID=UPI0036AB59AE